jgi:AraC-like DNA-binding protein
MPIATEPVPKPIRSPLPARVLPEDDFDAALWRLPGARTASLRLPREAASSVADVRWPADGGRITQLRSRPWEGATALFFDFRLNQPLDVCLDRRDELLLTFFLTGDVRGRVGSDPARPIEYRTGHALLRTPNRQGGYQIHIPGGCRNAFVQFRLQRQWLPRWLASFGVALSARDAERLTDLDDGTVLCNSLLTQRVHGCLSRIAVEDVSAPAAIPLFHARATELLTLTLLDLHELLRPRRSRPDDGLLRQALARAQACIEREPARAWSVRALVAAAGCSEARLQQAFRELAGTTAYQFVRNARLDLAARLLRETGLGVHAVAADTGWSCHGRFGAAFRTRHGCSPSAYRERARGGDPATLAPRHHE